MLAAPQHHEIVGHDDGTTDVKANESPMIGHDYVCHSFLPREIPQLLLVMLHNLLKCGLIVKWHQSVTWFGWKKKYKYTLLVFVNGC